MKHIVFLCEGQLGDLLILTPAVRAVKAAHPDSKITTIILQRRHYDHAVSGEKLWHTEDIGGTSRVMSLNPNVDQVIEIDRSLLRSLNGPKRIRAEIGVIRQLRGLAPDIIVCTFPQERFILWGYLSGAGIRVGQADQKLGRLLTHRPDLHKEDLGVRDYYLGLVEQIGAVTESKTTEFSIPSRAHAWAAEELEKYPIGSTDVLIAVHPGATGPYKIWPPEFFAEMIDRLQAGSGFRVLLCGSDFDRDIIEAIRACANSPVIQIYFDQDVARLAAILSRCRLCVTNDSGPRHLSVAAGVSSIAIMMKDQDRSWKIYHDSNAVVTLQSEVECPACGTGPCRHIVPEGKQYGAYCMRSVPVDRVIAEVKRILNIPSGSQV